MNTNKPYEAVNWNTPENAYVLPFWEQNIKQFWIPEEYVPSKDLDSWKALSDPMRLAYMRALGGLTLLDTLQSHTGMPSLVDKIEGLQNRSVLSYMCMMEAIHAKSYSTIFTTVASTEEINAVFEWIKQNQYLQKKATIIDSFYQGAKEGDPVSIYLGLAGSVLLESFLFYSGFFLPLWLCGHGQMVASADIIKKIVADEAIHGSFVGFIAQDIYKTLSAEQQEFVDKKVYEITQELLTNEYHYTEQVYGNIELTSEVKAYVNYNCNRAFMNLGKDPILEEQDVDPIVLNGLNTETTQHDFFSKKSTNYEKAIDIEPVRTEDFSEKFTIFVD